MSEKMTISTIDVYRLLIGELRYAYTRNNHLQPSASYDDAKRILPEMLKEDPDTAVRTAKQLCEECISDQIAGRFYDGLDDEFGNRSEAVGFVEWLIEFVHSNGAAEYRPYNHDLYELCCDNADRLDYTVLRLGDDCFDTSKDNLAQGSAIAEDVSKKEADEILCSKVFHTDSILFNHIALEGEKYPRKVIGEKLRIIEPESHKHEIYAIVLSDYLDNKEKY